MAKRILSILPRHPDLEGDETFDGTLVNGNRGEPQGLRESVLCQGILSTLEDVEEPEIAVVVNLYEGIVDDLVAVAPWQRRASSGGARGCRGTASRTWGRRTAPRAGG
jgi:hypothetical protein